MKKLSIISEQIKNNTYSYTGKGMFEQVVKDNKDIILKWLEELVPVQVQISNLANLTGVELQKRNYTRILTKIFPTEYKEFVSLNILVRDANIIAQYYENEFNLTILYDKLVEKKYLKYPGKYDKYVDFNFFQQFVMTYRDDLTTSLKNNSPQDISTQNIEFSKPIVEEKENIIEEDVEKEPLSKQKDTNWTQLLLGKLK